MKLVILGEPASKSNSRRLVTWHGRAHFIKSEKAINYRESALVQLVAQVKLHTPFSEQVAVTMTIYYASQRPDLDETLILDILQDAGVYVNDRLVRERHTFHEIDKLNPRAEIEVSLRDRRK